MWHKLIDFFASILLIKDLKDWKLWTYEQRRNFLAFYIAVVPIFATTIFSFTNAEVQKNKEVSNNVYAYKSIETPFGTFCISNQSSMEEDFPYYSKAINYLINYGTDFNDTISFYNTQKELKAIFLKAYPEILSASREGNDYGLYLNGFYHESGLHGKEANITEAINLYKKSKLPCAKLSLANILKEKKLLNEAYKIYRELANQKFPIGITSYAVFLSTYPTYNTDKVNIQELLKEAADLNNPDAYYHLAVLLQDKHIAFKYFETGAKLGNPGCNVILGDFYSNEDDSKSEQYYKTAMHLGSVDGMFKYSMKLINKNNIQDLIKGQALLKLAGELKQYQAKFFYAELLRNNLIRDDFPNQNTLLTKLYCETMLHGNKEAEKILEKTFSKDSIDIICRMNRESYNSLMLFKIQQYFGFEGQYTESRQISWYEDLDLLQIVDKLKK